MEKMKPRISAHPDDTWADRIILNCIRSLRLVVLERYKTSDLSGDEWRFSYMWQVFKGSEWVDLDGPHGNQEYAIYSFFPAFLSSHPDWHNLICNSIQFTWKGQGLIEMSVDGKPSKLLHAIGTIQYALAAAQQQVMDLPGKVRDDSNVCSQPGCSAAPVSLFRKIKKYWPRTGQVAEHYDGESYRRFCPAHLRRGDCGLDDADRNYELIEGVGPEGNEPDPSVVKPAVFGGSIILNGRGNGGG